MNSEKNITKVLNDKLRLKVTDKCNMRCWFCHSEGASGTKDVLIDSNFVDIMTNLRSMFSRVHITGGEPFLYSDLLCAAKTLKEIGYSVSLTTNGYFELSKENIKIIELLDYMNFSFHSLDGEYYSKLSNQKNGNKIVAQIIRNINTTKEILPININSVISGNEEHQSINDLIAYTSENNIKLKLVPELSNREKTINTIKETIEYNQYDLYKTEHIYPGSNIRNHYRKHNHIIETKELKSCYPEFLCKNCENKPECYEGFSFLRVGGNPLYCQLCIKKSPITIENFMLNYSKSFESMLNYEVFKI